MKTNLTIKNFRVFNENGVTIELNPITILTGCNSSGKSSIVKAVLLLNDYLTQVKKAFENNDEIELSRYKLDFYKIPFNLLGQFDNVVNDGSACHSITFEYTTYSYMISKDVKVQMKFASEGNDDLNNGYLHALIISSDDGIIYSTDKEKGNLCNLNTIKNACFEYLPIEYLVFNYCGLESKYEFTGGISEQDYEAQKEEMITYLRGCDTKRRADVFKHVRYSDKRSSIAVRCNINPEILENPIENGSLFKIPVIDQLNQIEKGKIKDYVNEHFLKNAAQNVIYGSNKIIDDFIASDCTSFGDYFKQWEISYLSELRPTKFSLFGESPALLDRHIISRINQDYYWINWYEQSGEAYVFSADFDENAKSQKPIIENTKQKDIDSFENRDISFDWLYETVMLWNRVAGNKGIGKYFTFIQNTFEPDEYRHSTMAMISTFAEELVLEVIFPDWCSHIEYASSTRAKVHRIYTLYDNDEFSVMLKRYFDAKRKYLSDGNKMQVQRKDYEIDSFMNRWIKEFEIGESVSIDSVHRLGAQITLHKSSDDKGRMLADEGFGITQFFSILLQIETAILSAEGEKVNNMWALNQLDGYGSDKFHFEKNTIAIEEPEIHLHPKFQSKLADMMVEAYKKYNIHFIVETHSEYLIRKLQVLVAGKDDTSELQVSKDDISILYVNLPKDVAEKGEPQVRRIGIGEDGRLDSPFGSGFYDEADNQAMELLRIKAMGK